MLSKDIDINPVSLSESYVISTVAPLLELSIDNHESNRMFDIYEEMHWFALKERKRFVS